MASISYSEVAISNADWWTEATKPHPASLIGKAAVGYIKLIVWAMKLLRKTNADDEIDWKKARHFIARSEGMISIFLRTPKSTPVEGCPVPSNWFTPDNIYPGVHTLPKRIVLYVHGGSYCFDRTKLHNKLAANLATHADARVLAVDYGLAPENPFPDAIEDVVKSYSWLLTEGYAPKDIAIVGDSAGAGLALAALIAIRDQNIPIPAAYVALCPWADLTFSGASIIENAKADPFMSNLEFVSMFANAYRQGIKADHPLVSPALTDLSGLPNTLVHAGGSDMLLDDARSIVSNVRKAGGRARLDVWEEMPHVWQKLSNLIPESKTSLVMIGHFIRSSIPSSSLH
ncbi:alpha/beta hydrolase [Kordiimonas aquimaris]|uniref:alpha/beta hydrolase n=1 Tax=Kordiimonas aquimaris TaxID=707591 RepID=UPI0021D065F2|nr:alpha/beta hydrolase [Kordiimonas aquimaris]